MLSMTTLQWDLCRRNTDLFHWEHIMELQVSTTRKRGQNMFWVVSYDIYEMVKYCYVINCYVKYIILMCNIGGYMYFEFVMLLLLVQRHYTAR